MSAITSWSAASDAEVTVAPASSERTASRKGRSTAAGEKTRRRNALREETSGWSAAASSATARGWRRLRRMTASTALASADIAQARSASLAAAAAAGLRNQGEEEGKDGNQRRE
uniref:Uncharacterized protein n=1 Tax=Oryza nivara TaxID=4536 RepID=A0A0E0GNI2_ORYNI